MSKPLTTLPTKLVTLLVLAATWAHINLNLIRARTSLNKDYLNKREARLERDLILGPQIAVSCQLFQFIGELKRLLIFFNWRSRDKNINQSVHSTDGLTKVGMPVVDWFLSDCLSTCSAESPGFTLRFEQSKDVTLPDGALHVANQGSVDLALEPDLNLRNTSSRAYIQTHHLSTVAYICSCGAYQANSSQKWLKFHSWGC